MSSPSPASWPFTGPGWRAATSAGLAGSGGSGLRDRPPWHRSRGRRRRNRSPEQPAWHDRCRCHCRCRWHVRRPGVRRPPAPRCSRPRSSCAADRWASPGSPHRRRGRQRVPGRDRMPPPPVPPPRRLSGSSSTRPVSNAANPRRQPGERRRMVVGMQPERRIAGREGLLHRLGEVWLLVLRPIRGPGRAQHRAGDVENPALVDPRPQHVRRGAHMAGEVDIEPGDRDLQFGTPPGARRRAAPSPCARQRIGTVECNKLFPRHDEILCRRLRAMRLGPASSTQRSPRLRWVAHVLCQHPPPRADLGASVGPLAMRGPAPRRVTDRTASPT